MRIYAAAALWLLASAGAPSAAVSSLEGLAERLEEVSRGQTPLAHIDTLLAAADVLPPEDTRLHLVETAVTLLSAVRAEEPRYYYLATAARLLAPIDRVEAERICLRLPPRATPDWRDDYRGRCWEHVAKSARDRRGTVLKGLHTGAFHIPAALEMIQAAPADGAEILQAMMTSFPGANASVDDVAMMEKAYRTVAPFNLGLAIEAALRLDQAPPPPKPAPAPPKEPERPDRAEELLRLIEQSNLPPAEKSTHLVRVLELTQRTKDLTRRLQMQTQLAARFAAEGATGAATKALDLLHASLGARCDGEACLESVDALVDYIAANGIQPADLRVRDASLAARLLLRELREQAKR